MGETTGIEWTDSSWNPWHGCHKISPGCKNCYMFRDKARYGQDPNVVVRSKTQFSQPLKWKESRKIFTCSWSDWFIEEADEWRDEAWDIIRRTPQHTYQILTKRIERADGRIPVPVLPNVWLGVSAENQEWADKRVPLLLQTPAAKRFLSIEPQLGPVDLMWPETSNKAEMCCGGTWLDECACGGRPVNPPLLHGIDWCIVGGESGHGARPMRVEWAESLIDQCRESGTACFVKQLGASPIWAGAKSSPIEPSRGKNDDMSKWPEALRVQQFPEAPMPTAEFLRGQIAALEELQKTTVLPIRDEARMAVIRYRCQLRAIEEREEGAQLVGEGVSQRLSEFKPTTDTVTLIDGKSPYAAPLDIGANYQHRLIQPDPAPVDWSALVNECEKAFNRIAAEIDCGCVPCMGQCRSDVALECELNGRRDLASEMAAKIAAAKGGGGK